jgi:hypothetical protein
MRNPLRSETEAFGFVLVVLVGAVVIIGAAYVNTWLGVAAAVVVVAAIVWWLFREADGAAREPKLVSGTPVGTHRVLILAPPGTSAVSRPDSATEIVVVVPALASTVEALTGDVDDRRADAEATAQRLASQLPHARGEVGADDPVLAVEDALRAFGADQIVVVGDRETAELVRGRVTVPVASAPSGNAV